MDIRRGRRRNVTRCNEETFHVTVHQISPSSLSHLSLSTLLPWMKSFSVLCEFSSFRLGRGRAGGGSLGILPADIPPLFLRFFGEVDGVLCQINGSSGEGFSSFALKPLALLLSSCLLGLPELVLSVAWKALLIFELELGMKFLQKYVLQDANSACCLIFDLNLLVHGRFRVVKLV